LIKAEYDFNLAADAISDYLKENKGKKLFKQLIYDSLIKLYGLLYQENTRYVLDKTPRYYELLSHIPKLFPQARIIILKRNPLAVLNSIIDTWQADNISKLVEFKRDLLHAPFLMQSFLDENISNPN